MSPSLVHIIEYETQRGEFKNSTSPNTAHCLNLKQNVRAILSDDVNIQEKHQELSISVTGHMSNIVVHYAF